MVNQNSNETSYVPLLHQLIDSLQRERQSIHIKQYNHIIPKCIVWFCNMVLPENQKIWQTGPLFRKYKNKSNIDELKGKMREYLAVRGGYHFVAFEAIVRQTKVPLAWVLQPKPVEPNEIQPAFHVTISFCATHLRKFRKWSSSDYSNFLNPW